jgi:thiamine-phosphate pyrophosphorylase
LPVALPRRPFLYAIVDVASLGGRRVGAAVADLVAGGAALLQLRAKGIADGLFLDLALEAVAAARLAGVALLINDRADIARLAAADGVHLGQADLSPADARRVLPADALVGLSTHNAEQLDRAAAEPADYLAVGPVFPTRSKASADPVVGLDFVRRARGVTPRPLVAIGGITAANAAQVVGAGADGVAVISALLSAEDVAAAARELVRALATS